MKTTIDLPDEVLHRAKIFAAERKTTLKSLIIQGLTEVMSDQAASEKQRKAEFIERFLKVTATNSEPMVPLTREEIYAR